ncbi:hypothetical protein HRG_002121 [Hirsutella rhossiliensis]|uniref:Uncharacterized protein n=1 Tax=Hirsutella rhossiliensis TaxID=111463 RepID=A0A9P8N4Z3_9HYPO|nr:uncharacterized protein HRG_02121 [Hirsutella rhossiliensis]KAH0966712.1 hypothetical protein HRG_02121 [Hirsutella rhossiliensis]
MAAHARSQAFWLSYEPAELESVKDVLQFLMKILPRKTAVLGGRTVRDGQGVLDIVACTPARQRVASFFNERKWKRKGARGKIQDAKWPEAGESPRNFMRKWVAVVGRQSDQFGSESQLFRVLDSSYERERERDKNRRRKRARDRPGRSSSPEGIVGVSTAPTAESQVLDFGTYSVQVDDGTSCPVAEIPSADDLDTFLNRYTSLPPETRSWSLDCDSTLFGDINVEDISIDMNWTTGFSILEQLV